MIGGEAITSRTVSSVRSAGGKEEKEVEQLVARCSLLDRHREGAAWQGGGNEASMTGAPVLSAVR